MTWTDAIEDTSTHSELIEDVVGIRQVDFDRLSSQGYIERILARVCRELLVYVHQIAKITAVLGPWISAFESIRIRWRLVDGSCGVGGMLHNTISDISQ